ncbi:G patch domain and KOW motifs-containing protein-like isoform X2 [Acanthaster planci]|uniref:G patch domain and KOW motifs-containing protein-like isoform X2 n=1 Tax=Acanthaster planci TaxID=133434 RepID=A0A8B7XNU5_ACAPL|nr:G patch domain and KOW motifs-containing protein-like isoform X2 [Acanthaster planci]
MFISRVQLGETIRKPILFTRWKEEKLKVDQSGANGTLGSPSGVQNTMDPILQATINKPKEKEKPLVIPLIKRNAYGSHGSQQSDERKTAEDRSEILNTSADNLDDDAIKEIIQDAAQYNEEWEGRDREDVNLTIPLLMQNRAPEGTETDEKLDVSIRPDEASAADYDQVPIEQFGMAMLRGMGWKEHEGIGAKMKKVVKPIEAVLRPKGQGLGADRRPGDMLERKRSLKVKPGDKKEEEEVKRFSKGVGVLVCSGAHKNLYGKIEGVDEDNARLVIKLALSGQAVTLSQYNVTIVEKEEYKRFSKDISHFSKGWEKSQGKGSQRDYRQSEYRSSKDKDSNKYRTSNHNKTSDSPGERYGDSSVKGKDSGSPRNGHPREDKMSDWNHKDKPFETQYSDRKERSLERCGKRRKIDKTSRSEIINSGDTHIGNAESKYQTCWLRPDLRVRFIDREYKKGRYYNSKVCIVDVVAHGICTCQSENGRILEDIEQGMVETLIPKTEMACVMIVAGKYSGQLGSLVKRDKAKAKADVQLLRDRNQIKRLDFDDICEYAGNIHNEEDY